VQRDDNIGYHSSSEAWRKYRHTMRGFIVAKMIEEMDIDELKSSVQASLNERYFYAPDEQLISLYAKYGGTDEN